MVYEPEVIGSYVGYLLKAVEQGDDYQDHVLWRILTARWRACCPSPDEDVNLVLILA